MKRIACPHCGFQNFEISAYCGRCERPLPAKKKKRAGPPPTPPPVERPAQSAQPAPQPVAPPEAAKLNVPPPIPPREDLSPMPIETSELMRAQEEAVYRKAEVRAATENLPEAAEVDEAELDAIEAIEAAGALDLEGDHPGEIEVPVELASTWQVAIARIVDATIVLAPGAGVAWLEALLFATPWHTRNVYPIDIIADWVHAHPDATTHGLIVTFAFGIFYHLMAGRRGGRTLGRSLTGTVLVRASGRALTWPILVIRMVLSLVSLALFGAGYFWALIDSRHRTWHDLLVGTVVVRRRVRLRATPQ